MRGDLSETSAADVCRALAASGADGVLDIEGPDGRGSLVWRDGAVIAATSPTPRARLGDRLVGAGVLSEEALTEVLQRQARDEDRRRLGAILVDEGLVAFDAVRLVAQEQVLDAVFDVLRWRYGAYRLEPLHEDVTPEVPLRLPVEQLLVEVARRQDEWVELERVIPDLASVPSFREQASADAALEPDEFAVLASIDGSRSVRELAADLGYGEFEAARIVYGLWLLGIVEITPPEDEIGRALEEALRDVVDPDEAADRPVPTPTPAPASDVPAPSGAEERPGTATPARDPDDPDDEVDLEALLARMDEDRPPPVHAPPLPPSGWVDPPGGTPPTEAAAEPEPPAAPADDEPPAPGPEPEPEPAPETGSDPAPVRDSDDVAELLRELSRLAIEEPEEEPKPAPPSRPDRPERPEADTRPSDRDDGKRKRRGLFGR